MSNSAPEAATTNVVGYFNNQKYPIQLHISRVGVTIEVKPGEYILDKKRRKINDPLFDSYKQLSRETSPTPVPLILIPIQSPVAPVTDGHAVHQVTEFRMNQRGFREPVMPTPVAREAASINNPSIRGMSVEEARRLRLIRPVREVPEDYGVPDTDSAMPPRGPDIPPIKEARDVPTPLAPAAAPAPLPQALTEAPERAQFQADLAQIQEQAAQLDEDPNGFLNSVVPNPPAAAVALSALPAAPATAPAAPAPPSALPLPQLDEEVAPAPPVQSGPWSEAPVLAPATAPSPAPAPIPLPARKKFICAADGRSFDFRSQLEQHVIRKFPHLREQLMAAYPKA